MPIAIAGMHRSGSSLITRLLNLCGLDLGPPDQLMPPAADNPEGFWESLAFSHVNDCILGQLGGRWDLPPDPLPGWEVLPLLDPWREMAGGLPESLKLKSPWGWKDPRNSLTLPFWRSLWPDLKVIVCVRNPLEVANSLLQRDQISLLASLKLWHEYYRRLLTSAADESIVITHFDAFFVDPVAELSRLVERLELPADAARIHSATAAVMGELRHSSLGFNELAQAGVGDQVLSLYRQLCDEGGPTVSRCLAQPRRPRSDYANAVRLALEFDTQCREQQQRIVELEARLRFLGINRDEYKQLAEELGLRASEMASRLSARRHRYADQMADAFWKVARPLQIATKTHERSK